MRKNFTYRFLILFSFLFYFNSKAQDVEGVWVGNFIQYIHNSYDVKMEVEKLPPGNIFSAKLYITDGYYFGQYNISGYICNQKNLEITTIVLIKENETGSWIDCLNGTFDLNDDETILTFTDTWLDKSTKNNACKIKYIQKDMFQCLRSAYLHKAKYLESIASFDRLWSENDLKLKNIVVLKATPAIALKTEITKKDTIVETKAEPVIAPLADVAPKKQKSETKIVAKNEDRAPIIDTFERVKLKPVYVKDIVEVSSAEITIEYWDRYTEDGDSINLYINNKPVLLNQLLTKAKKSITVHLDKTKNYLVLDAINIGTEPPNTASITIKDGKKIQNVSLTSTMQTSGALKIIVKKK